MASFVIEGGHRLCGEITPQGAKNEALQVLCAALLTTEPVTFDNVPEILDVKNLLKLISDMGVDVERLGKGSYRLHAAEIDRACKAGG